MRLFKWLRDNLPTISRAEMRRRETAWRTHVYWARPPGYIYTTELDEGGILVDTPQKYWS